MYYPECNILMNRTLDPKSKTPAFKCVIVRIVPQSNTNGVQTDSSDLVALTN